MTKVAVITGAASGIGAGLAREAARRAMKLVLADIDRTALDSVTQDIDAETLTFPTDVRDEAALIALADAAYDRFGQVDLLFNNAGVLASGLSWEIDAATWQRSLDININGVVNGLRAFVPRLLDADRPAHIVNTASVGGFLPSPHMAPYSATKFAIVAITEALSAELKGLNSKVNVSLLAPGPVKTAIMDNETPEPSAEFMDMLRGMLAENGMTPDEFAPLVFDAVEGGDYWIVPQPETLDPLLRQRMDMILNRTNPDLSQGMIE